MMGTLTLSLFFAFLPISQATGLWPLEYYNSPNPTLVPYVQDGSKLYLASSDPELRLSRITLTTNGKSITIDRLIAQYDDKGYNMGWPVNKDLTISTTNSINETRALTGSFFVSNPDMANDPNFLVYVVNGDNFTVDRSTSTETTLLLLVLRVDKDKEDPDFMSFYNTRVENFSQPSTTKLYIYRETPGDGYTDPNYKETAQKLIFTNPVSLNRIGNSNAESHFFDNIEPVQYSQMSWHIRAIGGIKFDVNQNYVDQSTYSTTKETTTGYTMSQLLTYNTTVNFKNTPNHNGTVGLLVACHVGVVAMFLICYRLDKETVRSARYYQYDLNATTLFVEPSAPHSGGYYVQYFRIEGDIIPSGTPVPATSPKPVEATTKLVATSFTTFSVMIQILFFLRA